MEQLIEFLPSTGLAILIVICLIVGIWKGAPKVLAAYKEANEKIVGAIESLAKAFNDRLTALENKVDSIEDKVDDIASDINKKE